MKLLERHLSTAFTGEVLGQSYSETEKEKKKKKALQCLKAKAINYQASLSQLWALSLAQSVKETCDEGSKLLAGL